MTQHIKISNVAPRIQFIGNGLTTQFIYPFAIFRNEDLEVYLNDARQVAGFTVSGAGSSSGGAVTFGVAPGAGVVVTLRRRLAIQRVTDFQESGDFRAATLNDELDYQTAALQNLAAEVAMTVRAAPTDRPAGLVLPKKAERAGKILGFDDEGGVAARTLPQGGVSAHGDLGGLHNDDHPHYLTPARAAAWLGAQTADSLAEGIANKYMRLAGAGTSVTAARSDHHHAGIYEPAFPKNTAFNKNFGAGGDDVAAGDHTHAFTLSPFALGDLGNVTEAGRAEGYALMWSAAAARWEPRPASGGGAGRFGLRNLIANATFRINQRRNFATTLAAGVYGYDRWRAGAAGCAYALSGSAVTITAGSLVQTINGANIVEPGPYTLSWEGTATATVNGAAVAKGGQVTLTPGANVVVAFAGGTLAKPQLEQNPVPTPFEQRPIELELQLCLPYYQKSYNAAVAPGTVTYAGMLYTQVGTPYTLTATNIPFQAPMRATPTVTTYSSETGAAGVIRNMTTATDITMGVTVSEKSAYLVRGEGGLTVGHMISFHWTANAEF